MAMHMTRCASHQALHNMTPGALSFQRDMMFDIPFPTDFIALQHSCQAVINQRVQIANAQRLHHEFQIHDQVLKKSILSPPSQARLKLSKSILMVLVLFPFLPTKLSTLTFADSSLISHELPPWKGACLAIIEHSRLALTFFILAIIL